MPGPCNAKKKKQLQKKKQRKNEDAARHLFNIIVTNTLQDMHGPTGAHLVGQQKRSSQLNEQKFTPIPPQSSAESPSGPIHELEIPKAIIEDPGNGPRVKDAEAFLSSRWAPPPSLEDPNCALFAHDGVLETLLAVLPDELAYILWFNKTRVVNRICPVCQRLYRLGDTLPPHVEGSDVTIPVVDQRYPHAMIEQQISGICSSMCFVAAAYNFPEVISKTWGKTAVDLDGRTCELLNRPRNDVDDMGLGLFFRMTRLADLGLQQIHFDTLPNDALDLAT